MSDGIPAGTFEVRAPSWVVQDYVILSGVIVLFLVLVVSFRVALHRQGVRRDARAGAAVEAAVDEAAARGDGFARVLEIYQSARSGSKAILGWARPGGCFDGEEPAWFDRRVHTPTVGEMVEVRGDRGFGDHHGEGVFYVSWVGRSIPPGGVQAWIRRSRRARRASRR